MPQDPTREQHDVVVIGAGQSGLAAGYHLASAAIDHVILEAASRVGDVWRSRYDSLRLYSPARYDGLPGLPFPGDPMAFPSGAQMADYLETYATTFDLPVRSGVAVERLRVDADGPGYVVSGGGAEWPAAHVIVATGPFQRPYRPEFARDIDPRIQQIHSADYRHPDQLADGPVLVVGASHSGADIAYELAASRRTYLSGRSHGQLPFSVESRVARVTWPLLASVATRVLSLDTPIGRKMAPQVRKGGGPLLRHRKQDLIDAGVEWSEARTVGVTDGKPTLADGEVLDVACVLWCTGFRPDFSWIELPILADDGWPSQERGVITSAPGLYILGAPFLHSFASMLVLGAGDDAAWVVEHIRASRSSSTPAAMAA